MSDSQGVQGEREVAIVQLGREYGELRGMIAFQAAQVSTRPNPVDLAVDWPKVGAALEHLDAAVREVSICLPFEEQVAALHLHEQDARAQTALLVDYFGGLLESWLPDLQQAVGECAKRMDARAAGCSLREMLTLDGISPGLMFILHYFSWAHGMHQRLGQLAERLEQVYPLKVQGLPGEEAA